MAGALRIIAVLGALAAVLAVGVALPPQGAVAHPPTPWPAPGDGDVSIQVETRAVVMAGSPPVTAFFETALRLDMDRHFTQWTFGLWPTQDPACRHPGQHTGIILCILDRL